MTGAAGPLGLACAGQWRRRRRRQQAPCSGRREAYSSGPASCENWESCYDNTFQCDGMLHSWFGCSREAPRCSRGSAPGHRQTTTAAPALTSARACLGYDLGRSALQFVPRWCSAPATHILQQRTLGFKLPLLQCSISMMGTALTSTCGAKQVSTGAAAQADPCLP